MEDNSKIKFHQQLLSINEKLGLEEVEALKFLCSDLISPKNLEDIKSAHKLFQKFMDEDLLNEEDSFLVAELLFLIKHHNLLQKIGYTKEKVMKELSSKRKISSYRVMLYDLSEEITTEDFERIKFIMADHIPKTLMTFLSLLRHMEKQNLLSEKNLEMLVDVCKPLSRNLIKRIDQYKCEREESESLSERPVTGLFSKSQEEKKLSVASAITGTRSVEKEMEEAKFYRMDRSHRGHCIIFNNFEFRTMNPRRGSLKDADELKSVFEWLGFTVTIHHNTEKREMEEILQLCRTSPEHRESDCFVCCVLTHGESGSVFSSDEEKIAIHELTSYFRAHRCPGLANKPKLFFFQACQGSNIQESVLLEEDAKTSPPVLDKTPLRCIPVEADFLLGMATVDGCCAIRHRIKGSWYIQTLCHQLKCMVPRNEDILTILTVVNNDVSQLADTEGKKKQMPQPAFTLRKKVVFPVPLLPPPSEQDPLTE
ncbi:caspase-10 [Gracilinanus agilis]|uniref:caspase-10 n=1 Tax=Gracilinanus agilis TaxID=191870 RepID=UPI001CFC84CC|nr:caspase-10 [Gracilinanus agilis]